MGALRLYRAATRAQPPAARIRAMSRGQLQVSVTLFAALFAAQAAVIAMSPVLAQAAADLDVSVARAGQLRTVTGAAAGITALVLSTNVVRVALRRQLLAAAALLAVASLGSAAAPGYALLALAQVPVGIAVAVLTTAGTLAAADWVPEELRTRTLSWALVGQPAAWIVGMPLIGVVGEHGWRYGWLALPFTGAVAAIVLVTRSDATGSSPPARRAGVVAVLRDRPVAIWLGSELLANAAWAGTLVFAGAFFETIHGTLGVETGALLAAAAVAYVAGNLTCRRLTRRDPARILVLLAGGSAIADAAFLGAGCGTLGSATLFSAAAFLVGGRTLVSSAYAVSLPVERRGAATSLRAATMQFGYFLGSSLGGVALAAGGYRALGVVMGGMFLAGALLLARVAGARSALTTTSTIPRSSRGALTWRRPSPGALRRNSQY